MKRALNACRAGSRAASRWLVFVLIAWALALMAPPACAADPAQGPGGPILVVTSGPSTHGTYYAEILRTEGFNAFQVADIGAVTPTMLAGYDVVLLAKMPLTSTQVSMLGNWVTGGGNLIAMAPDAQLAGLLGLTAGGTALAEGYLLVDTTSAPGNGIVGQTMQFHGSANRWTLNGATSIATLYSSASTATGSPAVSLRNAGSGKAAAFAYDLATSIVYTRHGNPAWAAQERDGFAPIRSDDKFYGAKAGDVQQDWVDLNKVSIPQADEQQRLLANLIVAMNDSRKPLPRFWYFPNGKKAVVIMTGDDHGNNGTAGRFDQFKALSPGGCSVANWECVRGTSYVYPSTPLTDAQVAQYTSDGFEVGLHVNTGCADFTASSLQGTYDLQVPEWLAQFPSGGPLRTQRHHCIVWSDWSSGAQVQLSKGMRLDTSYYFWPPSWVADVPGMFTGSAMPMRFTKPDGSFVDVYMAATQMTDESGQTYPKTIDTLLDRAVGAEGYYGAYTVNAHTDSAQSDVADAVVTSALARGVPIVSAKQMLTWLDGRNASSFGAIAFSGGTLSFTVTKDASANGLQAMLPLRSGSALLLGLTRAGATVSYSVSTVKGVDYAFFAAESGSYAATYGADSAAPVLVSQTPAPGSSGVAVGAAVIASFNEALLASSVNGSTFFLRDAANVLVSASVSYDSASRTATLKPAVALAGLTTYTATLRGGTTDPRIKDVAGNALAANVVWSFTTAAAPPPPSCPCSAWSASTTPTTPQDSDPNAVELGVRFTTSINGFITGVRFYKGTGNTGTHVGNLWSASGALLARATFSAETASGWQQVNFASPVPVNANTVYVASYYAPNGRYAADPNFFATSLSNGPVNLLSNGAAGGNGVYNYSGTTTFPSSTFNATNYWVDIVFSATGTTPPDTTPPTVSSVLPAAGATGVATSSAVSATFSEAMNAATIGASTFELRDAANVLVSASISYDSASRTATLAAALAASATYTATLRGGTTDPRIKDVAGNALAANVVWSFTTAAAPPPPSCPCSAWSASTTPTTPQDSDSNAVELGVRFTTSINGFITGVRFYKGTGNTGTHVGNLWSAGGALLARATFSAETASGWQQVNFASPVPVNANTVYVASYYAPNGRYAADPNFFATSFSNGPVNLLSNGAAGGNGVYNYSGTTTFPSSTFNATNYWVDIVFSATGTIPPDTTPPTVSSVLPAAGATGVATSSAVSATFSEAMNAATIGASFELRNAANVLVASNVSYDAPTLTARLTPTAVLAASQTYTATVRGGSTGVKDAAGNALTANFVWSFTTGGGTGGCSAPPNPIVAENCLAGSPASEWDISGSGDPSIQGFATDISVNRGTTVSFKVDTNATAYRFDIYRMGYYDGLGARKVASVNPSAALPQNQPNCLNDATTGLIDCGNWALSGSWAVPDTATSGIYFAKLVRADNGGASHIVFIVRDDASTAPLLFQTSDTTWQAYNNYGGNSLYTGSPVGRAYKVSYNRPFNTRAVDNGQDWLFNAEYPMVRWLESNGYDVAYISGVDSHRAGALLRNHKVFLSVGHDEYWSGGQRANVTAARDAGVHLAFFSGNEVFWKTRWELSIDGSNTANRTLVCYKETHANAKIDPSPEWTGTWRDPRFSPPSDGGRPENGLAGTIFMANDTGVPFSIEVPAADGKMRFWRNTSVASLAAGQTATLPVGTLGYEWDSELDNGARPPGLWRLSTTPKTNFSGALLDYGSNYGNGNVTHYLTQYRAPSGALVFGAGTIQWSWGLDASHDRGSAAADLRMQQATVNLFADMGVQPATLRPGLVAASASTDATPPASTIASPTAGSTLAVGTPVTISGSASDGGGVVGGVEISVDGGTSWHPAVGRSSWSYVWTPPSSGNFTIRTRAVDDSGNLEAPGAGITVTAGSVPDTTAPTVSAVSPANNATGVARTVSPTVTFSEAIDPSTINSTTFELRNASTNALVFAVVSYAAATRRATLNPSGNLAAGTRFTATVRGGATDPRVKDLAGNPLAANRTWSFTTR